MPVLKSQAKWEAGSQRPEVSTPTPNLSQPTWCPPPHLGLPRIIRMVHKS